MAAKQTFIGDRVYVVGGIGRAAAAGICEAAADRRQTPSLRSADGEINRSAPLMEKALAPVAWRIG